MLSHPNEVKDQIKTIIFDFGGVLFDIDYNAPVRAFEKLGVKNFDQIYSQSSQTDLFNRLECGLISNTAFVSELRGLIDCDLTDDQILWAWNVILLGMPKERVELVHKLKSQYRTFILSNTNAIHVSVFEKMIDQNMGLSWFKSAFEKVYYSNEIGIKKPYASTFLKICEWEGLKPEETLFIDDSIQHAKGAAEAGLHAFHLDLEKTDILETLGSWVRPEST